MNLEDLKSDYQHLGKDHVESVENLNKMKNAINHPVLKRIKWQLIFESILWLLILIVFYDFFDGHLKSFFWNVLLSISIVLLLIHNLLGYSIVKKPIEGANLNDSLKNYLLKIKKYSAISILSRVVAVSIFFLYLTSNIIWTTSKIWMSIAMFALLIGAQIYFLRKIWSKRTKTIEHHIKFFLG